VDYVNVPTPMFGDEANHEPEPHSRCWVPECQRRGVFHDWAGWIWCWRHVRMYGMRPLRKGRLRV